MGSGGGGTSTQYVKSETSNLPAYVQPYFTGMLERANSLLTQPYQAYGQERIAGFTPQQNQVQQNILGQQTPGQFGTATGLGTAAGIGSLFAGQYNPNQFSTQSFTQPGMASQYMSPYIQNALDVQKQQAIRDAQMGQLNANLGAARQGTYGGSRQLLASMERERNLGQQLGNIEATGLQSAFQNAQSQFNAEQAARMQAQQNTEQSRQFGANLGLQGLAQTGQMAQTLGNLGQMQSQTDLARLGMQQQTAAQQQALNQQYLDTAYQDFINQRDYPIQMLQQYSSLLHGVPVSTNSTSTQQVPTPSLASQIMGTGLGALSMYKALAG